MPAYEYKIITGKGKGWAMTDWSNMERQMNSLSADGWELVTTDTSSYGSGLLMVPALTVILRRLAPGVERSSGAA